MKTIGCEYQTCQAALNDFLNKVALEKKPVTPPSLAHYEIQTGGDEVKLSFAIKVF